MSIERLPLGRGAANDGRFCLEAPGRPASQIQTSPSGIWHQRQHANYWVHSCCRELTRRVFPVQQSRRAFASVRWCTSTERTFCSFPFFTMFVQNVVVFTAHDSACLRCTHGEMLRWQFCYHGDVCSCAASAGGFQTDG